MLSRITSNIIKGMRTTASPRQATITRPNLSVLPLHIRSGWYPPSGTYMYRMTLDPYTPDMLDVKIINGEIVVKGKIEEKVGEDRWTYEFVKRHRLPSDVDLNTVKTRFEHGELVVTAKLKSFDM
uniref:SHSP domain-containing protein n=1 Tax=Cuerna arida TaxID=1464854 RepID=A0A1B6F6S9_9HEMI